MLNRIWFWLLLIGILYGFGKGLCGSLVGGSGVGDTVAGSSGFNEAGKALNAAALDAAKLSVEICIGLIGIMALWLGLLRIAQDAGLVETFARILQPVTRWLFPEIPVGHPAQGAVVMNLAANLLGLENAATPMGLKAMRELQTLNATSDTATNSMAMFLAINTSNITLIPFAIIGYRAANGSTSPAGPLLGMLLATTVSTTVAILAARWLSTWSAFAASDPARVKMQAPNVMDSETSATNTNP